MAYKQRKELVFTRKADDAAFQDIAVVHTCVGEKYVICCAMSNRARTMCVTQAEDYLLRLLHLHRRVARKPCQLSSPYCMWKQQACMQVPARAPKTA